MRAPSALPEPDEVGREHAERVAALVAARIDAGPLPFVDYMALALYAPGLGYYMAGAPKFGADGDFVTAPELSPLFGQCIAAQCRDVLDALAGDAPEPGILELGAGSGRLAASVVEAFDAASPPRYTILEPSAELRQRQRALLEERLPATAFARVAWIETLPERFDGVIVANEVMDALPVERFVRRDGRTLQVCVDHADPDGAEEVVRPGGGRSGGPDEGANGGSAGEPTGEPKSGGGGAPIARFVDTTRPAPAPLADALAAIEADLGRTLPDGYASELCPALGAWIGSLADALGRGVVLLADYGYPRRELYLAERVTGTLACHYRHRAHGDPYLWPGLQDITAHVDFTRAAEAGVDAGLELLGYATQAAFLLGCGLPELAERRRATLDGEPARIADARAVRTLTLPGEMGERFQFIAFGKGYDRALRGFGLQDLTHRL